jgi:hypothetical protein
MMGGIAAPAGPKKPGPTKPEIRPSKKLIAFNWRRIFVAPQEDPKKVNNFWDKVPDVSFPMEEVEELFENKKKPVATSNNKVVNVPKKKTCLEGKTAQGIAIAINRLPPAENLRDIINNLNTKEISTEQISMLIKIWPPPEEVQTLIEEDQTPLGDQKWDKAEEFVLKILGTKTYQNKEKELNTLHKKLKVWRIE